MSFEDITSEIPEEFQKAVIEFATNSELSVEDSIDALVEIIKRSDPIVVVEKLKLIDHLGNRLTIYSEAGDQFVLPPRLLEFVSGMTSYYCKDGSYKPTVKEIAAPALDMADAYTIGGIIDQTASEQEAIRDRVEFAALNRELAAGRFIYSKQYDYSAIRAYSPHNQALKRIIGFTIEDAVKISRYFEKYDFIRMQWILENKVSASPQYLSEKDHEWNNTVEETLERGEYIKSSDSKSFIEDCEFLEEIYEDMGDYPRVLWMDSANLRKHLPDTINSRSFDAFLKRMSAEPGEGKEIANNFRYPYDFNPVHNSPLFESSKGYITPRFRMLKYALVETFYYDLIQDEDYGDPTGEGGGTFGHIFGDYLETWAGEELAKVFSNSEIVINPNRSDNSKEAADVMVLHSDKLYVFECKTAKLPVSTRSGEFDIIQEEVRDKLGEGHAQAAKTIEDIRQSKLTHIKKEDQTYSLSPFNEYLPVVLIGEPYDMLATLLFDELLERRDHIPYTTDIYSFQIICEVLKSPELFYDYTQSRKDIYERKNITSSHEIDYLGVYLHNNYSFPDFPDHSFVGITDYSDHIAKAINHKYGL